jgi:hypothetical protein
MNCVASKSSFIMHIKFRASGLVVCIVYVFLFCLNTEINTQLTCKSIQLSVNIHVLHFFLNSSLLLIRRNSLTS